MGRQKPPTRQLVPGGWLSGTPVRTAAACLGTRLCSPGRYPRCSWPPTACAVRPPLCATDRCYCDRPAAWRPTRCLVTDLALWPMVDPGNRPSLCARVAPCATTTALPATGHRTRSGLLAYGLSLPAPALCDRRCLRLCVTNDLREVALLLGMPKAASLPGGPRCCSVRRSCKKRD
jgi:hypothetical protein